MCQRALTATHDSKSGRRRLVSHISSTAKSLSNVERTCAGSKCGGLQATVDLARMTTPLGTEYRHANKTAQLIKRTAERACRCMGRRAEVAAIGKGLVASVGGTGVAVASSRSLRSSWAAVYSR